MRKSIPQSGKKARKKQPNRFVAGTKVIVPVKYGTGIPATVLREGKHKGTSVVRAKPKIKIKAKEKMEQLQEAKFSKHYLKKKFEDVGWDGLRKDEQEAWLWHLENPNPKKPERTYTQTHVLRVDNKKLLPREPKPAKYVARIPSQRRRVRERDIAYAALKGVGTLHFYSKSPKRALRELRQRGVRVHSIKKASKISRRPIFE